MDIAIPNQKIEPSLRAAMDATPGELAASATLSTGTSALGLWEIIVLYSGTPEMVRENFPEYDITFLLGNYAIFRLPERAIDAVAASPLIIYIEKPKRLTFEVLSGKRSSCITPLQENAVSALTGKGVLISVIDSGIDYPHPDFESGWQYPPSRPLGPDHSPRSLPGLFPAGGLFHRNPFFRGADKCRAFCSLSGRTILPLSQHRYFRPWHPCSRHRSGKRCCLRWYLPGRCL